MSNRLLSAYHGMPEYAQDMALSAYGLYIRQKRYGGEWKTFRNQLRVTDKEDSRSLENLQTALLRDTVVNALSNVSYYANKYRLADVASLRLDDLQHAFAPIHKSVVADRSDDFVSRTATNLSVIGTSGSTGSPLRVLVSVDAVRRNYAFFARFLEWHGVSPFDESATFAGRLLIQSEGSVKKYWRRNAAMHDTLFSSYHLSEENIPKYIKELERRSPKFIDSYPSSIYRVAEFIDNHKIPHTIRPRVIITSSETLLESQRTVIERAFGCPVRDQYGSAEMACFVAQCESGRYHVAPEYGYVEVIDGQGKPAATGEMGQLCLTGFVNDGMPLIRYLIGDVGKLSGERCSCGRSSQLIESLEGRLDDVIVTPSGAHIGRLDPAFKGVEGVRESQIVQISHNAVVVRLVTDASNRLNKNLITANLRERLGDDMEISIEMVDSIPKEPNGKFRAVKNLVSSNLRSRQSPAERPHQAIADDP